MTEQTTEKRAMFTMALDKGELRALKAFSRARGLSMSALVRQLLRRELVDLARR
jgi:hypothetical protein